MGRVRQHGWDDYHLESKSSTNSRRSASKDLKTIYLSKELLFAWMCSIQKPSEAQDEEDWFLQQAVNQLFYKAKMHSALAKTGGHAHLIYTFDSSNLRPYYPRESDYVATCSVDASLNLKIYGLSFHGTFAEEYNSINAEKLG